MSSSSAAAVGDLDLDETSSCEEILDVVDESFSSPMMMATGAGATGATTAEEGSDEGSSGEFHGFLSVSDYPMKKLTRSSFQWRQTKDEARQMNLQMKKEVFLHASSTSSAGDESVFAFHKFLLKSSPFIAELDESFRCACPNPLCSLDNPILHLFLAETPSRAVKALEGLLYNGKVNLGSQQEMDEVVALAKSLKLDILKGDVHKGGGGEKRRRSKIEVVDLAVEVEEDYTRLVKRRKRNDEGGEVERRDCEGQDIRVTQILDRQGQQQKSSTGGQSVTTIVIVPEEVCRNTNSDGCARGEENQEVEDVVELPLAPPDEVAVVDQPEASGDKRPEAAEDRADLSPHDEVVTDQETQEKVALVEKEADLPEAADLLDTPSQLIEEENAADSSQVSDSGEGGYFGESEESIQDESNGRIVDDLGSLGRMTPQDAVAFLDELCSEQEVLVETVTVGERINYVVLNDLSGQEAVAPGQSVGEYSQKGILHEMSYAASQVSNSETKTKRNKPEKNQRSAHAQCTSCGKLFDSVTKFRNHVASSHYKDQLLGAAGVTCKEILASEATEEEVDEEEKSGRKPRKRRSGKVERMRCPICVGFSGVPSSLARHLGCTHDLLHMFLSAGEKKEILKLKYIK